LRHGQMLVFDFYIVQFHFFCAFLRTSPSNLIGSLPLTANPAVHDSTHPSPEPPTHQQS
jgi:hypothetical protein